MNERKRVIFAYGETYEVWNERKAYSPDVFLADFRSWSPDKKKWNPPRDFGGFPKNASILYDSADPMVGIPNGTEWVHDYHPIVYRVVNGSIWRRQGTEAWVNGYNFYIKFLLASYIRYNPDLSIYTEPEWLVALRAEAEKPQKPPMEEGKFYSPNTGPDSVLGYRIKNNCVEYWYAYGDNHRWIPSAKYGTPEDLAACGGLREVPNPVKPIMEQGKFYSPTEKYNIGTVYRVNTDGTVSFWFEIKKRWENCDPNLDSFIIRNGSKIREVPDPESKPCYIAADGRRIPVGSKFVYFLPQKYYADFTVEKTDGSGTWRTRSTGKVDPSMATFNIESCLNSLNCYTLELPK